MIFFLTLCESGALLLLRCLGTSFSVLKQFPHIHEWVNTQLYTQSHLQHISGAFSVCGSLLSSPVLWTLATLPSLDSQLCLLYSGSLMSSASVPPPCTMAWKLSPSSNLGLLPGSHNLFLVSQESLSFTVWGPMSWEPLFYIICLLFPTKKLQMHPLRNGSPCNAI